MNNNKSNVVGVGGLGGSGTRVLAQFLRTIGFHFGNDLNDALDNLTFTRLFKNPQYIYKCTPEEFNVRFSIFNKYMNFENLSTKDALLLLSASITNPHINTDFRFLLDLVKKIIFKPSDTDCNWCWKEPNTHLLLEKIVDALPHFKYIHVIRHGLDMALSENTNQLINWGEKYGIVANDNETREEMYQKQLNFWIASNTETLDLCKTLNIDHHVFNYSNIYSAPLEEFKMVSDFLDLTLSNSHTSKILNDIDRNLAKPKYTHEHFNKLSEDQLNGLKNLGF